MHLRDIAEEICDLHQKCKNKEIKGRLEDLLGYIGSEIYDRQIGEYDRQRDAAKDAKYD